MQDDNGPIKKARTPEQAERRREEIIRACISLYDQKGYDGVTFQAISLKTSFSRPTIYNYYRTKEELLLDVLRRECLLWQQTLEQAVSAVTHLSGDELAGVLVRSLKGREKMLSLFSMYYKQIGQTITPKVLDRFHEEIQPLYETLHRLYGLCFPDSTKEQQERFRILLFSLISGFYPVSQMEARRKARTLRNPGDFAEVLQDGICSLAKGD